jgi:membrane fusion protein (multidrug efflux system)
MRRRDRRAPSSGAALALALAAAVAAALGGAGCRRGEHEREGEEPAHGKRTVRCARAETAPLADAIELRGTIAPPPDRDAQIAPQVAGRIEELSVREGDAVADGQQVARIDAAPLADQAREAEAALAKTRAELRNAEATRARTQRVYEHGIAARQEVDDATARAEAAKAAESEAAAVAQRAQRQVDRARVRSPLAGVVVRILRRPGELVDGTPATPVLEVADPSRLELVSDAAAADLVRVHRGQAAEVTVAALPGARFPAVVSVVSPAVDRATGLGTIRVAIDLTAGALKAGVRPPIGVLGAARITVGAARAAVLVPRESVRAAGAGADAEVVVCGADGLAHVRRIRRGTAAAAGKVEVVDGVAAGESVAVDPVIGLAEGDQIEVAP